MVEAMNNFGCYHLFAPEKEQVDRLAPKPFQLDVLVPQTTNRTPRVSLSTPGR